MEFNWQGQNYKWYGFERSSYKQSNSQPIIKWKEKQTNNQQHPTLENQFKTANIIEGRKYYKSGDQGSMLNN